MTCAASDTAERSGEEMAPAGRLRGLAGSGRDARTSGPPGRPRRKQPWRRDPRLVRGSIREGQGFAFWRKQKIQRDYNKLLKKERHANAQNKVEYTENYPEHLKHLYLAEEEMLKKQRTPKNDCSVLEENNIAAPKVNVNQRKVKTKTSNQKAKQEYEKIRAERQKKKEAARKKREEREQAQKLYKQKKMEAYKILSKKTRKGQPNLNLQMEYLLQKIQQKS